MASCRTTGGAERTVFPFSIATLLPNAVLAVLKSLYEIEGFRAYLGQTGTLNLLEDPALDLHFESASL